MALPDPLVLKNSAAAVVSFSRRLPVPNGNEYVSTSSTPTDKRGVTVRTIYSPAKGGTVASNRNIATFSVRRVDDEEKVHTASLSLSLLRPMATDITDADIENLYAYMAEFLVADSGGYKTRFTRGEV